MKGCGWPGCPKADVPNVRYGGIADIYSVCEADSKARRQSRVEVGWNPLKRLVPSSLWLLLWLLSLIVPAVSEGDPSGKGVHLGFEILTSGWMGLVVNQFGWLANVVFPIALLLTLAKRTPRALSLLVTATLYALAVNAMFWRNWYWGNGWSGSELYFLPGYYLWFCAILGSATTLLIRALLDETPSAADPLV